MTKNTEISTSTGSRWNRLRHWYRAFDAALHDDENPGLRAALAGLNQRIARLETRLGPR